MRNWKVQTPMTAQLNQETIDYMIAYVASSLIAENEPTGRSASQLSDLITLEFDASLNPVHLLVKEKEFKYGKGKEYIAFCDGGKNQFGKDVKYVKFFYYYDSNGKMKPNDKTYTFGLEKARTFWNEKVKEGYTVKKNPDAEAKNKSGYVDEKGNIDPDATVGNYQATTPNGETVVDVKVVEPKQ